MATRRGTEFWRQHIDGWKRSGVTQVAYCARHELSIKTFCRWLRKEKLTAQASPAALTLVPLAVAAPVADTAVLLRSPGGWQIELGLGASASWLASLLKELP